MADKISKRGGDALLEAAESVFIPNDRQRKARNDFWSKWNLGPSKGEPTLSAAINETGCTSLTNWWNAPGFKDWFLNDMDHVQRLENLFDAGLDVLGHIITSSERDGDKLKAIELVAKLSMKIGKPEAVVTYADIDIGKMKIHELDAALRKLGAGELLDEKKEDKD